MATEHGDMSLEDIKRLLAQFAKSRAGKSKDEVEKEFGDLLLYLILLAGKSGVDLVAGANEELDRLAAPHRRHSTVPVKS